MSTNLCLHQAELWKGLLACLCLLQFGKMMLNRALAGFPKPRVCVGRKLRRLRDLG